MGLLKDHKCYLSGPMDRVSWEDATNWRTSVKKYLWDLSIGVLDPCDKPVRGHEESPEWRSHINQLKDDGDFDKVADEMKEVCRYDLRMVDVADFIIAYIDMDSHMCGTYHEIFEGIRQRKPVLIVCNKGISDLPNWLFGVIPYTDMFGNSDWGSLLCRLHDVNRGMVNDETRWRLFDYNKIFGRE